MAKQYADAKSRLIGPSRRTTAFAGLYLAALLAFATYYLEPSLFRSWFFSSDEYVFVAEVIRFLHQDFRQQFFDIPGTPFMFLSAALWAVVYAWQAALGLLPPNTDLQYFTFHHLPALFTMMRGITLFFYLCSIILVFVLAAKLTNKAGACVASLLVLMSPTYSSYSSFVRTESLAVCLILISVLCLIRGVEGLRESCELRSKPIIVFIAGFLAGLAAASRLHTITASLPLLLLLLLTSAPYLPTYPKWLAVGWKYILACGFVVCCAAALAIHSGYLSDSTFGREVTRWYPNAFISLYSLLLLLIGACIIAYVLHLLSRTRPLVDRFLHPAVFLLLSGAVFGFFLGTPTILWQYRYFLQSVQMYTTYLDQTRLNWPIFKNVLWFLQYYISVIAPDNLSLSLIIIGVLLIVAARDRYLIPFVVIGFLFFLSKPINLVASPHHVIAWLPFWAIVAGYPVAKMYDVMRNRFGPHWLNIGGLMALLGIVFVNITPGPKNVAANTVVNEARMKNIAAATQWIKKNTESDASIAISYFCFNPDTFFTWLIALAVPVPKYVFDGRRYMIWWGERSALKGLQGYACASPRDLDAIKFKLDLASPGQGTDPYTDKEFRISETFGDGESQIDVFRFNFIKPGYGSGSSAERK